MPASQVPSRTRLRQFIQAVLPTDADLTAVCIDSFPEVEARFTAGMDRVARLNLLIVSVPPLGILAALHAYSPERAAAFTHLLAVDASPPAAAAELAPKRPHVESVDGQDLIDFTLERSRHESFEGREDVLARLDAWLFNEAEGNRGFVLITGGPGMGKSAILHEWLRRQELRGSPWPHHFLRRGQQDWDQPHAVKRNLPAQLESRYPTHADPLAPPARRLSDLLLRISQHELVPSGQRLVLVIDGLDEAAALPGENPLPLFLPWVLPQGVWILCSSRPSYPNLSWLEARDNMHTLALDSAEWSSSNEGACRAFWNGQQFTPPLAPDFIEEALQHGSGNLLYAVKLCQQLRGLPAGTRRVEPLPRGLDGFLEEVWQHLLRDPNWSLLERGLGLMCAASESLPLSILDELLGNRRARELFLQATRPVLLEEPAAWRGSGEVAYRPYHESFRHFIEKRLGGPTAMRPFHRELAENLGAWPNAADEFRRGYALRHGIMQRVAASDWPGLKALCFRIDYLFEKLRTTGLESTEGDLDTAAELCSRAAEQGELRSFAWALRAESHRLYKEHGIADLASLLHNRLLNQGWSRESLRELTAGLQKSTMLLVHPIQHRDLASRTILGHTGAVNACSISPNGKRIISASADGTIRAWDRESGRERGTFQHGRTVTACAVSPDSRYLISAGHDHTLMVWDVESGRNLHILEGHGHWVNACAVSPSGRLLVSGSTDHTIIVWDLEAARAVQTLKGHRLPITSCAFGPDDKLMVSGARDTTLRVWDLEAGRCRLTLSGHEGPVKACAFSPDGKRIVSASEDHTLKVWDRESGAELATLSDHEHWVNACAVSSDGQYILSGSRDETLKVWELASGRLLNTLTGHTAAVIACALSPDTKNIVSGDANGVVKVWEFVSRQAQPLPVAHQGAVTACAMSGDGKRVVSGSWDRTLKIWDFERGHAIFTLTGHTEGVLTCALSQDSQHVLSGAADHTLKLWALENGQLLRTLTADKQDVTACSFSLDGSHAISGSGDGRLRLFSLQTGREVCAVPGHKRAVRFCETGSDGGKICSGDADGIFKIWNLKRTLWKSLKIGGERGIAGSPSYNSTAVGAKLGQKGLFAACCAYNKFTAWELTSGKKLYTVEVDSTRQEYVTACAISSDGRRVAIGRSNNTIELWDGPGATCLATLYGVARFYCLALEGARLVAGDAAGNVWILQLHNAS